MPSARSHRPPSRRAAPWFGPPSSRVALTTAVIAPVLLTAALSALGDTIQSANAALVLVVVIVGVAATGHRAAGIVAALASAASFAYFLTDPAHHLGTDNTDDLMTAVLLVLVGVAVSEIAQWGRRRQLEGSRRLGHLDGMVAAARLVSRTGDPDAAVDLVGRQIAEVLRVPTCAYEPGPPSPSGTTITEDGSLLEDGVEIDPRRSGLPTMAPVTIPVVCSGEVRGAFVVFSPTRVVRPDHEQLRVAAALAHQAGAALTDRTG